MTPNSDSCGWPEKPCDFCEILSHLQPCAYPGCPQWIDDRDPQDGVPIIPATPDVDGPDRLLCRHHANPDPADNGCQYCIDGNQPAGTHDLLGPVYTPCRTCVPACHLGNGDGLFPADFNCLACCTQHIATTFSLALILCPGCLGVVDLIPLHLVPADLHPEVNPHDH